MEILHDEKHPHGAVLGEETPPGWNQIAVILLGKFSADPHRDQVALILRDSMHSSSRSKCVLFEFDRGNNKRCLDFLAASLRLALEHRLDCNFWSLNARSLARARLPRSQHLSLIS
jgi:hypothetical protein